MKEIISVLTDARKGVLSKLAHLDQSVATLSALPDSRDDPTVAFALQGRERLQLVLDELDDSIARIKAIQEGNVPREGPNEGNPKQVIPGQYMGMKLSTAVQAYLSERGRGPITVTIMLKDLIAGGFQVYQTRAAGPNKGKPRDPDTRDLRLLANNNRVRFAYDSTSDTISLRPAFGNDTAWSAPVLKNRVSGAKSN